MKTKKNNWGIHIVFIIFSIICIVPLVIVISASLTSEADLSRYGFQIIPKKIDFTAYEYLLENSKMIVNAYVVTVFITVVGTFFSVLLMSMCAYSLSRPRFRLKGFVTAFVYFPTLFSGGMTSSYIINTRYLHLQDKMIALIIPGLINVFHIFMLRTFFKQLPEGLFDAAKVDGASETRIFFTIALRLSKPVLATVAFLGALGRWNSWQNAMLYIRSADKYPLQYLLQRMMMNIEAMLDAMAKGQDVGTQMANIPTENLRMALLVVCIGPMMCFFPFFQKYFAKGMTVGAIKG